MPGLITNEPYDDLTGAVQQVRTFSGVCLMKRRRESVVVKWKSSGGKVVGEIVVGGAK